MSEQDVKKRYAQEPWGKLLIEMGWEPYDTESAARRVAEYAADEINNLHARLEAVSTSLRHAEEAIEGLAEERDTLRLGAKMEADRYEASDRIRAEAEAGWHEERERAKGLEQELYVAIHEREKAEAACAVMREALKHIAEYWNGGGDRAAVDAAEEARDTAISVLLTLPATARLTTDVVESAAARVHDAYLREAKARGWPVKPELDVPYSQLSDDVKALDRATAQAALDAARGEKP